MTDVAPLLFRGAGKTYLRPRLLRPVATIGLDSLDLELRAGEIFGLLGLNGSGKTTAMKLALGLLRPTRGEVRVFGLPAGSREARSRAGYLPELPYFYPQLSPREVLRFYGRLSGVPEAELGWRVEAALDRVGLGPHAGRRLSEFSKGMLQRVGLGQAVLHEPALLVLDEPVSGLDPLAIAEFRALFARLREEGRTLLLSSHSISEAERLCDRVGVLARGRLVRVLEQREWSSEPGRLEELFVHAVREAA